MDRQRDQRRRAGRDLPVRSHRPSSSRSQYRIREKLPREALSPMTPVRYTSSDGLEIPAYLTCPRARPARTCRRSCVPHGGPWARDDWGYDGIAQFLSNRGYVVLQPNFRGSTGYGKKFLNAGNKQWGDMMQDDLTWGVKYLVAQGIADPKRVGHPRRLLRRLRDAGRPGVHAGRVRRRRLDRRAVEHHHAARLDSAVLGGGPQRSSTSAWAIRGTPEGTQAAGAAVAAELGPQDHDAAAGAAGRQRPAREAGRVGSDRHRAARPRLPGRIHRRARRGPRVCAAGEQHGRLRRDREVPGQASRRPLPGVDDAGGRRRG